MEKRTENMSESAPSPSSKLPKYEYRPVASEEKEKDVSTGGGMLWSEEEGRRAGRKASRGVEKFTDVESGEELWLVKVPMDFDTDELDRFVLTPEVLSKESAQVKVGVDHEISLDPESSSAQIRVMIPNRVHRNGLKLGPPVVKCFNVSLRGRDSDDVDSDEGDSGRGTDKVAEIVSQLKSKPRKQIEFAKFDNQKMYSRSSRKRKVDEKAASAKKKTRKKKKKHQKDKRRQTIV